MKGFKSISIQQPRLTLLSNMLSQNSHRVLKVCSKNQYSRTKTQCKIVNERECQWVEMLRVSLTGGDTEIGFEIFEEHTFGYNPEELINIWSGKINIQEYNSEFKKFDVVGADLNKVGTLELRVKTYAETSSDKPVARAQTIRKETVEAQHVSGVVKANIATNHVTNTSQQIPRNVKAQAGSKVYKQIWRQQPIQNYKNQIEIYSMVASLKNIQTKGRQAQVALQIGDQVVLSTTTKNRGLEPVWIETLELGVNDQEMISLKLLLVDDEGEKQQVAVGTLLVSEVRQRKHIISKQVQMSLSTGKSKCGLIYLDVRYRSRQGDVSSPPKAVRRNHLYESLNYNRQSSSRDLIRAHNAGNISSSKTQKLSESVGTPRRRVKNSSVSGENGTIVFPRALRFDYWVNNRNPNAFYVDPSQNSFFTERKSKKSGPYIGYGDKFDFTKETRNNPGVGNYRLPCIWDRYN